MGRADSAGGAVLAVRLAQADQQPRDRRAVQRLGYPDNFYLLVGGVELLGAVALLIPRVAAYGASALVVIMIGASFTHLLHAEYSRILFTGALMVFLFLVALARRPDFLRRR